MKKPNFVLSIAVNVIRIFAVLVLVAGLAVRHCERVHGNCPDA